MKSIHGFIAGFVIIRVLVILWVFIEKVGGLAIFNVIE